MSFMRRGSSLDLERAAGVGAGDSTFPPYIGTLASASTSLHDLTAGRRRSIAPTSRASSRHHSPHRPFWSYHRSSHGSQNPVVPSSPVSDAFTHSTVDHLAFSRPVSRHTDAVTAADADEEDDDLGSWAFRHHKDGLICRIERKECQKLSERLRLFWAKQTAKTSTSEKSAEEGQGSSDQDHHSWRISLAELQRMQLRKLQCKLVRAVVGMRYHDQDPPNWAQDLKSFVEAIKDYDYMIKRSKSPRDPFLVTGERKIDDYVLRTILNDSEKLEERPLETIGVPAPWEEDSQPIGGTRVANVAQSAWVGLKQRLAMAALGGALLVGPMWLMVKRNDLNTSLVSTTLFVVLFGLLMAAYLEKAKDVMSATAAYAAVLVVFVGLGTQATSSGAGPT